ncbi:hypothetical protein BT69DRAFT_534081 [Atractiella rhizophila]|nr:hypothetical protein BT69DRAFT_534081 [Atractiella rhizophila]
MSDDPLYTEIQGVTLDGKLWPSAFHIYLASRFPENLPIVEKLRNTRDVEVAKKLTNDATPLVAFSDWEEQDLNCLRDIIWGKFKVSPSLQDLLLITGRAELVFVDDDTVLGSGKDGKGLNMIGTVLMKTRTRLSKLAA